MEIHRDLTNVLQKFADENTIAKFIIDPTNLTNKFGDYLNLDEDTADITYVAANRVYADYKPDNWSHYARQSMKPARIARKILKTDVLDTLKDADFEDFANRLKGYCDTSMEIRLVEGEEIRYWYHYDNHNAGYSCMSNVGEEVRTQFFVDNVGSVSLLVAIKHDKCVARALVWHTDKGMALDYVYTSKDHLRHKLVEYARSREWWTSDAHWYGTYTHPTTGDESHTFVVNLSHWDYANYPHLDTFKTLSKDEHTLTYGDRYGGYGDRGNSYDERRVKVNLCRCHAHERALDLAA